MFFRITRSNGHQWNLEGLATTWDEALDKADRGQDIEMYIDGNWDRVARIY